MPKPLSRIVSLVLVFSLWAEPLPLIADYREVFREWLAKWHPNLILARAVAMVASPRELSAVPLERWIEAVESLPRRQTRVLTWPLVTVFGFIAQPERHIFLKPNVTRVAAREYEYDFEYRSRPNWETYTSLLRFAETVREDNRDLRPRDMIDLQSFLWVQGSDEYET